jgi:hypothetical protein
MNKQELAKEAAKMFSTPDGKSLDILFGTSDGKIFFTPEEAEGIANKLEDKTVTPYYRDNQVREMAKKFDKLQKMVHATDYLKLAKVKKLGKPQYFTYLSYCSLKKLEPISEQIYLFIAEKVFSLRKPIAAGQKATIYMYNHGIVEAVFMRRYAEGQVYQYMDTLVFTCPTNTELMSGSYFEIFEPLLDEHKK